MNFYKRGKLIDFVLHEILSDENKNTICLDTKIFHYEYLAFNTAYSTKFALIFKLILQINTFGFNLCFYYIKNFSAIHYFKVNELSFIQAK